MESFVGNFPHGHRQRERGERPTELWGAVGPGTVRDGRRGRDGNGGPNGTDAVPIVSAADPAALA